MVYFSPHIPNMYQSYYAIPRGFSSTFYEGNETKEKKSVIDKKTFLYKINFFSFALTECLVIKNENKYFIYIHIS